MICAAATDTSPTNDAAFVLVCLQMHGLASVVARSITAHDPSSLTPLDAPKTIAKPRYCCRVCSKQFTTSIVCRSTRMATWGDTATAVRSVARDSLPRATCGDTCLFTLVSSSSSVPSVDARSAMKEITVAT